MSYHNNPRIVTNGLLLCYDMNNPRCYPGTGTTIYNLADSTNYPSMYPHTSDSANLAYIDFVTTNPAYVKLTKGTTSNVNTQGNFLRGTGGIRGTFRIYNKALTAAEVLSNYNAMKPRFGL